MNEPEIMEQETKKDENKVKAGIARRDALTSERRVEIARAAAKQRWQFPALKATHEGILRLGPNREIVIPCAVLEDGTRVLSERGLLGALGMKAGARDTEEKLPRYLRGQNIVNLIEPDLKKELGEPLWFKFENSPTKKGVRATLLPDICNVWLKGRDEGVLKRTQLNYAKMADILMRGLAVVGITALVDEATGFQYVRARTALEEILEEFVAKELRKWVKTFPDEFYKQIIRLKGWELIDINKRGPVFGKITNNLIYRRLAPGVLQELKRLTPKDSKGRLKRKLFQRLTEDIGHPRLRELLASEITLMRIFDNGEWELFMTAVNKAIPLYRDEPLFCNLDDMQDSAAIMTNGF